MIYTNDGKGHIVLDDRDMVELVREYMGNDATEYVEDMSISIDTLREEVLDCKGENEGQYDYFRDILVDIRDTIDEILKMADQPRMDKRKLRQMLTHINYDLIYKNL